jgi:hypothetical protein
MDLSVFESWRVSLKAFGVCRPASLINKENFAKVNSSKSTTLHCAKTARMLEEERKRVVEGFNRTQFQNKMSERAQLNALKNPDLPVDVEFESCSNPRVLSEKKFSIKTVTSNLFFNHDEYARSLARRKRELPVPRMRMNLKEIVKFSEELSPEELAKIEVRGEKLDVGSVFVGSMNERELVITSNNNKTILVELDLAGSEALAGTRAELAKVEAFGEARYLIKLKPSQLGSQRIPITYIINKKHIFEMEVLANVTLVNLGFSTKHLKFSFVPHQPTFAKVETLIVTNHGSTNTKFMVVEPNNKSFVVVSSKEQEVAPGAEARVEVKYEPVVGGETGEMRVDCDKMVVKVMGGA